jgi:predicted transcriptional regulator
MKELTDTEILERIGHYTDLHMKIIEVLVPEMKRYLKIIEGVKMCYKYYLFPLVSLVKETGLDTLSTQRILNDFVKDGLLLAIITQPPENIFSVTDRGKIYFERLLEDKGTQQ